jgi:hypothetical protein
MFELLVAAKLLILAPQTVVGTERATIETRLGAPLGVGTDLIPGRHGEGTTDRVVTLDWPDVRVRLYEAPATKTNAVIGVTVTKDLLKLDSPVHIGVDRSTVLTELGAPAYEDADQIVYSLQQESGTLPNDTLRFVFRDDRVVGIDWTFPLE